MAKSSVSTIISKLKTRLDYNITDTDLDSLLLDMINDANRQMKQWFFDAGIFYDISKTVYFQTVPGSEYRDIRNAIIVGDTATFTGIAGDKLNVTIDGTTTTDIDISACTTIALVATAINTAVGSTVAIANSTSGTLQITSPTTGATSNVTIADGATTVQTVVGDLFSDSLDRTASGITDVDDITQLSERVNDRVIPMIPYSDFVYYYSNPSNDSSDVPDYASRFENRIYFGPMPSSYNRIYMDYIKLLAILTSSSTMPFDDKYDPLILAETRVEFLEWQDPTSQAIPLAIAKRDRLKLELITNAAKNYAQSAASMSRNQTQQYGPQAPTSGTFF